MKLILYSNNILTKCTSRNLSSPVWKLCSTENYSRMRLKLLPQFNADTHIKASQLRDNTGTGKNSESSAVSLLANIAKEVSVINPKDDDEEDLSSLTNSNSAATLEQKGEEKMILTEPCALVIMTDEIPGNFKLTTNKIYFTDLRSEIAEGSLPYDFEISLSDLREVHLRRYNLNRSAIEVFLIDQNNYFFNFSKEIRNKIYSQIMMLNHPNLYYAGIRSGADLLKASKLTKKWVRREISNFDYLMQLNMIAGRTYNDLNQYPIFPWILRDYRSKSLNLDDPQSYRDLSKPIGIQNPDRIPEIRERYETFEDPTGITSKFHYGTHYSNAAGVMHYLLRLEPFASLHIQLQSGRFDCADRQFHSLPMTWKTLLESHGDVKELIPEFFYLPDFLRNISKFDLGKLQSGDRVDDVILPPWADCAEDFIRKHRAALESDYVSTHLHEWIDLIFGYKQKGKAAVEALNVFYYCTYEGAVDIDAIDDITHRNATIGMIKNFGQTPTQLLKEPHPKRMTQEEAANYSRKQSTMGQYIPAINLFDNLSKAKTYFIDASAALGKLVFIGMPSIQTRSFIHSGMLDSLIALTDTGFYGLHGWLPYSKSKSLPFTFELDASMASRNTKKCLSWPFAPDIEILPKLFCVTNDAKLLFSGGFWDNSLRIYNVNKGRLQNSISIFNDLVTCIGIDKTGRYLIVGSRDSTAALWEINHSDGINANPIHHYYGHDDEVTCVGVSSELDIVVSGSKDGSCVMHMIRTGSYVMSLRPKINKENFRQCEIISLTISEMGNIALFCRHFDDAKKEEYFIHLYSINGRLLTSQQIDRKINTMIVSKHYIITGDAGGAVVIRNDYDLTEEMTFQLNVPVRCASISSINEHILVGLDDGKLIIISYNTKDS
ncbi:uncharacterized protein TRIADDRAFT_22959 [Trichoplax adhaerens]|uniref:BEACH domain-containing protein n=1 Tax=Trichoplax adhaerens TaxID=10228 RepID=B3RRZ7_TRIAD|nr:hypothetical protein TRIADDRAFT_22959 [Trichoplax adhaerens]EDV26958.1 hypothetical protein TRIADDRAFT_22959 [Trichoplax adhaerens]|eukprot:XP_002110954.1 hypothetical protein TRIADDRAFT_22959 [Trichoplax adhaerens]